VILVVFFAPGIQVDASHGGGKASYRAYLAFPPTQRGAAWAAARVNVPGSRGTRPEVTQSNRYFASNHPNG
jgi:hypothetical protein